ncbi:MAG: GNAT family N-acetyltransferase, partial [Actinobacteria bacterium]|nr:GNAT family N-acetyltransferase [Actinomycetota bacterium]
RGGVRIRRAGPADIPALRDFFAALSGRTRYLRFFGPLWPTGAMLRRLSGGGADAVIATAEDAVIGHAMACDQPAGSGAAATEIGVVVADGWQGRGVGAALVRELVAAAADRGATVLAMDVLPGNRKVLDMIAGHWEVLSSEHAGDTIAVRARLPQPDSERPLAGLPGRAAPPVPGQPGRSGPGPRQPVTALPRQSLTRPSAIALLREGGLRRRGTAGEEYS